MSNEFLTIRESEFQINLDRIEQAYIASSTALSDAYLDARDMLNRYEADDADDWRLVDGVCITTQNEFEQDVGQAYEAMSIVREAFITSVFHYWERAARKWTKFNGRGYPNLRLESEKFYPVNPKLDDLNALNNLLKHNSEKDALRLAHDRPEYFSCLPFLVNRRHGLRLKNEHVMEAIEIVRSSGPKAAMPTSIPTAG